MYFRDIYAHMEKNMTKGSPLWLLTSFTLPLFAGNLFQQVYAMVDTIVVGRFVGVDALAALGAVGGFSFMVIGFAQGLGNGFAVLVSQRYGAKDMNQMRKAYTMSILASFVVGLIISVLFALLSMPLLEMINTPENIIEMSNEYILIIYLGLLPCLYYNLFSSILRAVGDSKSPLIFLLISSVLNVILDLVFVLVIPLACAGVAIATVLSQGISAIFSYIYIKRKFPIFQFQKGDWKIDWAMISRLLKVGLPGAIQFSVCAIGVIFVQIAINGFGSDIVAAYSVGNKIENIYSQMFPAIGMAISTYAGQNLGAGEFDRIRKGFRAAFLLTVIWSVAALFISFFMTKPFALLFVDKNAPVEVLSNAQLYVNTVISYFLPLGMIFLFRTGCQGLGSGTIPMISSITELIMRAVAAFTLPVFMGYLGICYASPVAWVGAAVILPICYVIQMKTIKKKLNWQGKGVV